MSCSVTRGCVLLESAAKCPLAAFGEQLRAMHTHRERIVPSLGSSLAPRGGIIHVHIAPADAQKLTSNKNIHIERHDPLITCKLTR